MALTEMRGCTRSTVPSALAAAAIVGRGPPHVRPYRMPASPVRMLLAMQEVWGTLVGRWYVTLFGLTFLWCAVRQLGWRRTAIYSVIAVGVGALAENGSVHLGFPYTRYTFNPSCAATSCSSATCR